VAHFLRFLSDTLCLVLSGLLAFYLRTSGLFEVDAYLLNHTQYLGLLGFALILWHCLLAYNGGYSHRLLLFRIDELLIQFQTANMLFLLLMAASFIYKQYDFSRLIVFFSWLFFVFLGSLGRQISYRFLESLYRRGWFRRKVLLSGASETRELFETRIRENPGLGVDLLPSVAPAELETLIAAESLDDLFLFEEKITYANVWNIRSRSRNPRLQIHLVPTFGNLYVRRISGGFFDGTLMVSLDSPLERRLSLWMKRAFDVIVSLGFLLLMAPFWLLIALLLKLDSAGPVLFAQIRIGRYGNPFTIYKFRTMHVSADAYAPTPTDRADPRITRIGALLRSSGLDELPQLFNVLIGDMSLVGPRPEMPFIVQTYTELERKRLNVRPGITGLWQVYARTCNLPIHSHIEYDLYYIENISFALDLMIVLDTIPTLVLRTGI
jgi:exopolysaccharide biosynthesis polyprenyl glycosylphosphotransferase